MLAAVAAVAALALVAAWRAASARGPAQPAAAAEEPVPGRLAGLTPGMLVRYRDERLIVERTLHFNDGTEEWTEHRLADDRLGRSLWLEIQERDTPVLTVYERLPIREDPPGARELTRDGMTYRLSERGVAEYRSHERAGPGKHGQVEYIEYVSGRIRLAYERFDSGPWEVSLGQLVEPDDVELA